MGGARYNNTMIFTTYFGLIVFIWKHQPTLWREQGAGKIKLLSGLTSQWFTCEIPCDLLLFSSYVALPLEGRPLWVGDSRAFPAPNTFVWGSAFKNFMLILIKQGKHWHLQTQFNLLSFMIVMRTNGSRGMEKKPLEEVLRVLRGRDHRGERACGQAADMTKPWHFLDTCLGAVLECLGFWGFKQ